MSGESATDIPCSVLNQLALGIDKHGLCKCVITLANELNVKSMHYIRQGPKSKWFFRMFDCWLKERRKDVSLLALLSAIVRIRRMGILVTEVAKDSGAARSTYAECLKRHIGKHWQQLAYHMGLTRTTIDSIALKHRNNLTAQVNEFLETMQFPDLGPYTMILILVALRSAALDCVENEVLREAVSRGYMDEDGHVVADESSGSYVTEDDGSGYAAVRSQDSQNKVDMVQGGASLFRGDPLSPSVADQEDSALQLSEERGPRQKDVQMGAESFVSRQDSFDVSALVKDEQSRDRQSEGIKAMLSGDDEDVILALFQSDVSQRTAKTDDGKLPIHLAVGLGYLKVLEYLITHCNDSEHLNAQDVNGVTPLMIACNQGQEEPVQLLLQNGADPNVLDQVGRTCLHFIETVRNPRILEALCNHDADVNSAKSDTRITPLTVACVFGDLGSVQTLVERGADPNYLKHQSLLPPLVGASQEGNAEIVKFLLKTEAHQDAVNPEGYTALHFAALKQHADVVQCLLEGNSPCPDILAQDNVTPLMCAAASGSKEIAEALLAKEAEVDAVRSVMTATGKFQVAPLAEAALSGHLAVAEVLVEHGAYVQNRSGGVHSVLEFACVGGNPDIVRLILDRIQFQEEHADELQLPLHRAVEMGNYQCAQVIIDKIGLDKLKQQGQMDPSTYELLLTALNDYEATLERNHSQLPNTGSEVSRTIGKSSDIFLSTRNQHGCVQRAVDIVKYALLFEPMSAVMVEKKLLIDVCKHILLYSGELGELVTNALTAGWNDVVHFLADYGNKPDIANPDDFLRRIERGDPMTPLQFLISQVTVDHLWDTAKAENKVHVEQFFAETQRRTQNGGTSKTAKMSLRRHFFESTMRDTMARLKNSQCYNSPETCPTAVIPQFSQPADGTLSCLEDGLDSAFEMEAVANVKPAQGSEPLQQFVPDSVAETRQPVIPSKPVSTMSKDDSESVYTRSTDSSMPNGRVPPPNSLVFRPQKVHPPLEQCLDKLWTMKSGMNASTTIDPSKCRVVLSELSKRIGSRWTFLARFLGLSESTIQRLKGPNGEEHKFFEECCHNMLREWICTSPSEATWGRLSTALVRIMRADLVDVISLYFQGQEVALQYVEKSIGKEDISTLSFVANHVSSSWSDLAKQLNVKAHIDRGAHASLCDEDQCLDVLMTWVNMVQAPCFKMLYKALEEIGFGHVITLLEQRMQ